MNVETANRLQMLRKKNNLSQEELAEKIGISRQAVSKWERAEASPDTDNLILLAKLYGVTLDELLRTESVHFPDEDGISLRKEDYIEDVRPADDDGEIYPNGRNNASIPQGAPGITGSYTEKQENSEKNTANGGNTAENVAKDGMEVADFVKNVAEFTVNVTKEALGAAAKGLNEANENIKNNKNSRNSSDGSSMDKDFDRMDREFDNIEKSFEKAFDGFDEKIDKMSKEFEQKVENGTKHFEEKMEKKKYPATLLDKLFPLIIACMFLLFGAIGMWEMWILFLFIPVYYILSDANKKYKAGDKTLTEAALGIFDGFIPFGVTFIFLVFGELFHAWSWCWIFFLFIPVYYIFSAALKKYAAGVLSPLGTIVYFLNGSVPIMVVIAFLIAGLWFHLWGFAWVLFFIIPFYYIIADHIRKNKK
ncbi:MAG: helix-turn-helix domain-containing protein [Oscillospiraceae bacterium]|nr:helix-turn-helix domain-containing protein [Oscillospiraceae bacterium]